MRWCMATHRSTRPSATVRSETRSRRLPRGALWVSVLALLGSLGVGTAVAVVNTSHQGSHAAAPGRAGPPGTPPTPPVAHPPPPPTVAPTTAPPTTTTATTTRTTAPTTTTSPASPPPTGNPAPVCGTAALNAGPTTPPTGAVTVAAGVNSAVDVGSAGNDKWLAAGLHVLGAA